MKYTITKETDIRAVAEKMTGDMIKKIIEGLEKQIEEHKDKKSITATTDIYIKIETDE